MMFQEPDFLVVELIEDSSQASNRMTICCTLKGLLLGSENTEFFVRMSREHCCYI